MMTNLLFWFQVIMAWFYTVPQVVAIIRGKTEGLNLAMYVIFMAYIIFSFWLSVSSYRLKKERTRKQVIIIFVQWMVCICLILLVGISKITWSKGDTIVTFIVVTLSLGTILKYRGIKDAYSKALINVWCKSIPQLWLAYTIFLAKGGDGLPLMTLIAGHLTSTPRLIQVIISGRQGWDRPTRALLIGESANVITWIIVTFVWLYFSK